MTIYKHYLTPNPYSRPGKKLHSIKAIVMHWTAVAEQEAETVRNFFETRKTGMGGYGSAHYIIGWKKGEITECIPDNEIAYHVGSSQIDPASGRIYTDEARRRFGKYAESPESTSPNFCTLGIELCAKDSAGNFSDATLHSAVKLCAYLCRRHNLTDADITTHHNVVGWKDCPKLWTDRPELFEKFRVAVRNELAKEYTL